VFFKPVNGGIGAFKTQIAATHPVMLRLKPVKTHGYGIKTCLNQLIQLFTGKQHTVGYHSPQETATLYLCPHLYNVFPNKRFSAGGYYYNLASIQIFRTTVKDAQKITHGRIFQPGSLAAVTPTMSAIKITAQRAFPEQLLQLVFKYIGTGSGTTCLKE
jgi:hypothetical protein